MGSFLSATAVVLAAFAGSYYGVKFLLGPDLVAPECNYNIQGFELRGVPVYWQMQEGHCQVNDVNFEFVRANIEESLKETEVWPEAECYYVHTNNVGFVFKFGTDYYDVEDLDCIEPLREMQEEVESNINLMDWLKENFWGKTQSAGRNVGGTVGDSIIRALAGVN